MTTTYLWHAVLACSLAATLLVAGCGGHALPVADTLDSVQPNEVIVVGRIDVSPPPDDIEQSMKTISPVRGGWSINPVASSLKNVVVLLTDNKLRKISDPSPSDYNNRIEAPIGKTFYVRAPNTGPLYVIRSEIFMDIHAGRWEKALLPSGYKIDIKPGDRAIYIGTIKYYRDEFFETKRVELIDDYERENAAFKKKFGGKIQLRKALIKAEKSR